MILKKPHWILALALWASCSYSNSLNPYYGYTGNAFIHGNPWDMGSVLPEPSGLEVNGVFYTYTPQKETAADFEVEIGNWNSDKSGYVWKETDNWDGAPGGISIIKNVPLPYVPRTQFGEGFLDTTGEGTVTDANVVYSYKVDPCYNPQTDINCPGFIPPPPPKVDLTEVYDATEEDAEIEQVEVKEVDEDERDSDEMSEEEKEEEERAKRLERSMSINDNSALFAENLGMLQQLNATSANVTTYLNKTIQGGTYTETTELNGGTIPDNKGAKRMNWATQKLHEELVNLQYKEKPYE